MNLIVDTNVFISGVFFSGIPYQILHAWKHGYIRLVLSPEILEEYKSVGIELSSKFPEVDFSPWIELTQVS